MRQLRPWKTVLVNLSKVTQLRWCVLNDTYFWAGIQIQVRLGFFSMLVNCMKPTYKNSAVKPQFLKVVHLEQFGSRIAFPASSVSEPQPQWWRRRAAQPSAGLLTVSPPIFMKSPSGFLYIFLYGWDHIFHVVLYLFTLVTVCHIIIDASWCNFNGYAMPHGLWTFPCWAIWSLLVLLDIDSLWWIFHRHT